MTDADENAARLSDAYENAARLSGLAFLTEILYANVFRSDPDAFQRVMAALIDLSIHAPKKYEPVSDEDAIELQIRGIGFLRRFEASVLRRIHSGVSV